MKYTPEDCYNTKLLDLEPSKIIDLTVYTLLDMRELVKTEQEFSLTYVFKLLYTGKIVN
jgi:hypothetical protein